MSALQPSPGVVTVPDELSKKIKRAERLLLVGALLVGSQVSGPIGVAVLAYGFILTRKVEKLGFPIRPWPVTIMGVFCLVDAGINMFGWALATLPHDAIFSRTWWYFYGRDVDAAYFYGFNSHAVTGGVAVTSEAVLMYASVFLLFPMRIAGAWAFLKLKRWGFQVMIVTGWMYAFLWVAYTLQFTFQPGRYQTTYGVFAWWFINCWYITPFIMLPWLYIVNRKLWRDDDVNQGQAVASTV
ncbi:hypothetical protein [Nocardia sp. NBC_01388]|uniref:hypothetical protein n=1 Tax=Nocardia sp. NBC_01388 TaxID=2903596 RepID=UPI0032472F4C